MSYGSFRAVDSISFEVNNGEIFACLDPTARVRRPPSRFWRDTGFAPPATSGFSACTPAMEGAGCVNTSESCFKAAEPMQS